MGTAAWLTLPALMYLGRADVRPAEWAEVQWTPEMAAAVRVAHFEVTQVNLVTALSILDNECGLVFGYADVDPALAEAPVFDLATRDRTVGEIVKELEQLAPEYEFSAVEGVVAAVRKCANGSPPALLDCRVPAFEASDLSVPELERELMSTVGGIEGAPPLYTIGREPSGAAGIPTVTLHLRETSLRDLLCKAGALVGRSWVLTLDTSRRRAIFSMGKGWALPINAEYKVTLAADAPREPVAGAPPSADAVRERVASAVLDARLLLRSRDSAVEELASLLDDRWARMYAFGELRDAIKLLGQLRAQEAVEVLVRNIDVGGATALGPGARPAGAGPPGGAAGPSMAGATTDTDERERSRRVHEAWIRSFPAIEALQQIGPSAVGAIVEALAGLEVKPLADTPEPPNAAGRRTARIILLCEALKRILGAEMAAERLRSAALEEQNADRARRLKEAADRITEGLVPKLE